MTSGITSIVDQLTGRSRIPESARPVTQPVPPKAPKPPGPHARLTAALGDEWCSVSELMLRAKVSENFAYSQLPQLVDAGVAEVREVPWAKGKRREYRRAR
ncbi:MAG: hypothetical protein RBT86_07110 [Azospira sp.]|jgi:hypothetical protein|nr:hypothetical protein [Azospira sp.]